MGMSSSGSNQGRKGRRRGRGRGSVMSEINVTPMVDVMLVLLIIFMVAAPLMTVGVPVTLPDTQAKALNVDTQPITVSINATGEIFIQETPITLEDLEPKLKAIASQGYEERIFIRGDKDADYGTVAKVMAKISSSGYKNLGLVSLPEQGG